MTPYPKYKPSGIEWIGDIPEHWEVKKLKYVAHVRPSNVNKKTEDGEIVILLCNYIDVYKNEFIDSSLTFMEASASEDEIAKFTLLKGDVLLTKDSETPDDIAKPALVRDRMSGVLCGYHLSHITPDRSMLLGEYLFRLLQEPKYNSQFQVSANGVTRYGISSGSISGAFAPLPPLPEQTAIANYLDAKIAQIDSLIDQNEMVFGTSDRKSGLLQEYRTALISEVVTGKVKVV